MKEKRKFNIIAVILIILFAISISPKTLQNDTFYTIKIGELIVKNKNIDMLEHFSWHSNLKYTYPHWLYDVIIYLIYNIGGMFGIYISTCIFAAILGIVFFSVNVKINKNQKTPTTWSHIIANEKFGTCVTESNGGYTWYKNSRLNRVSSWDNSIIINIPSEIIYLQDEENGETWTPTAMVKPDDKNYNTIFGFGYAKFVHCSDNIMQELEVYVPINESAKINVLTLTNNAPKKKKIRIIYYIKPVNNSYNIMN